MTYTTYSDTTAPNGFVNGVTPLNATNMEAFRDFCKAGWFDSLITSDGAGGITSANATVNGLVGIGRSTVAGIQTVIQAAADANVGLVLRGHSPTQSGNLLDIETSTNSLLFSVSPAGNMAVVGTSSLDNGDITTNGSGNMALVGLTASGRINLGSVPTAQVLSNNATITLPTGSIKNVSATANVTGIIMSITGAVAGDVVVLVNSSAAGVSVTFSGTGNVRLGAGVSFVGGQWVLCIFDGTQWYVQY